MSRSSHNKDSDQLVQNQNNQMSDDPQDGGRGPRHPESEKTPVEKAPRNDAQDQSTIEAFGEEGAGIAAKE